MDPSAEHIDGGIAQKFRHEKIPGIVIDLLGRPHLLDHAGIHHHDEIRDAHGLLLVVGDKDGGDVGFLLDSAEFLSGLQPQPGVQIGKGFVQQKNAGHLDQGSGDGHPLLLTAGELAGLAIHQVLDLNQFSGVIGALNPLLLGQFGVTFEVFQREENILAHR